MTCTFTYNAAAAAVGRGLQITNTVGMANVVLNQISTPFNPQVYTMTKTTTASTTTIPKEYKGYHPMRKSLAKQEEEDNKNQELKYETNTEKQNEEQQDKESVGVQESETKKSQILQFQLNFGITFQAIGFKFFGFRHFKIH